MALQKILIANRGEIAVRVIETARSLGYRTVAVYSDADAASVHVALADEAVRIGPAPATESYLSISAILDAAARSGADAVHPGYGFLSENASFARACVDAGLVFIGPPAEAIELMGNKRAAKAAMASAGVPCLPGRELGAGQSVAAAASEVGFPLMVKAAAGGGGRGMRLVSNAGELEQAIRGASAEALSAFGDGELILERALSRPRHIEIQIVADGAGNFIHLGERDCSVQRRHQKVIEESPSPAVDASLRARMGEAAIEAARSCNYVGAGTVEFLLDEDGEFYFLEMNTRLQVEHGVTELVTGIDLVAWQIHIAAGGELPMTASVEPTGHAIEARIYAEDPARSYMPQTGVVSRWTPPTDVRTDHGLVEGLVIGSHYDAMLAKVIAFGADRDQARRKLASALSEMTLFGVVTNKSLLQSICRDECFAAGGATTAFLATELADNAALRECRPTPAQLAVAALAVFVDGGRPVVEDDSYLGWRSGGPMWSTIRLDDHSLQVSSVAGTGNRFRIASEKETVEIDLVEARTGELVIEVAGVRSRIRTLVDGDHVWLDDGRAAFRAEVVTYRAAAEKDSFGSGRLTAPLDGVVTAVAVGEGAGVSHGELIMVLEAMKMEHRIEADVTGQVSAIHIGVGDQVKARQLLAEIAPTGVI